VVERLLDALQRKKENGVRKRRKVSGPFFPLKRVLTPFFPPGGALDPGDLGTFRAQLAAGTPRYEVALEALAKPATFVSRAQEYDRLLLHGKAGAAEADAQAVALLFAGDRNYLEVLLASGEYFSRAG
jgi:hypothetical protein